MKSVIAEINKCTDNKELENFLRGLLTPQEIKQFETRIEIVKLLKMGLDHRTIAERVGVGVATVTRGSREIQLGRFTHV